jgi:tetratricopeptide (TPR) repeat protein
MSDELKNAIDQIPHNLKLCSIKNELFENIDLLTAVENKILFVLSGSVDNIDSLLSSIHDKKEIGGIFIYDNQESYQIDSVNKYSKLYGIFVDYKLLIERLSKTVRILIRQQIIINIGNEDIQKCMRDLTKRSEAMEVKSNYLHRLQLISGQAKNKHNKQDFLKRCRSIYSSNKSELSRIDEFERTYVSQDALKWYTKNSFFFKIINFVLRDQSWTYSSTEVHYFVADLCSQLKEEWKKNPLKITRLYRGSNLSQNQIDWMTIHVGHTISISGFLSTSKSINVAKVFAGNVLFDIELDPTLTDIIYADVSKYSLFEDEEEVLFDFDSIFKIMSFKFDETIHLWIAKLIVSNNSENIIISHLGTHIHEDSPFHEKIHFCQQLRELNRMNQAINNLKKLLNSVQNDIEKFFVYYEIGLTYFIEREFKTSLTYIQLAYDIIQTANHPDPSLNYNDDQRLIIMGLIYACMQNYDLAFDMFFQSLNYIYWFDISKSFVNPYYIFIERLTEILNSDEKNNNNFKIQLSFSIGYWLLQDYKTAQKYFESMENHISNEDYRFLLLYHCFSAFVLLGLGYRVLGYDQKMLVKTHKHFDRVLILAQNWNNDNIINTMLENMARLYEEMREIDSAIKWYNGKMKRLDSRNKKNICRIFERVCKIYMKRKQFNQAIEYCHTTLLKFDVNNDDDGKKYQAIINEYLGDVYKELKDYVNAISYYQKSLELDQYRHDFNSDDNIIRKMNTIYEQTKTFHQAIEYYHVLLSKFHENIFVANIYASLGDMYKEINDFINARIYYENSIQLRLYQFDYYFVYLTITKINTIYKKTEQFDRAIEYYHKILSEFDIDDNYTLAAEIFECLGDAYIGRNDSVNGLIYYTKSVKFYSTLQSLTKIHQIYMTTQQFDKAIEYYHTALLQANINEDNELVASFNKYLGDSFTGKIDSINSLFHYTKSLELYQNIKFMHDSSDIIELVDIVYIKTQQFDKAIEYYQTIISKVVKCSTFKCMAEINKCLGDVYRQTDDSINAIIYYEKSLEFYECDSDNYDYQINLLYRNIGDLHLIEIDMSEMIIKSKIDINDDIALRTLNERLVFWYRHIGKLYLAKKHLHIALKYNENCLEDMANVNLHIDIGDIEGRMANLDEALDHYKIALDLIITKLLDEIELQGQLHDKIAYLYERKGQSRLARYHHKKALAFYRRCDPVISLEQSNEYESDAESSSINEDYISAIYFTTKSLRFHKKTVPLDYTKISYLLNQIGWFYCLNGEYKKALRFCVNSLELFEKYSITETDPEQSYVLHSIGFIYLRIGDDQKAFEYCQKSMNILQQNPYFQNLNQVLADIFELFADIYMKRDLQLLAMENYRKSLDKFENILPKQYLAIERVRNSLEKSMK